MSEGINAQPIHLGNIMRRISPGSLKVAARVKTADFSLLRAEFDGEEIVFGPWLSLRLVEHDRIVSWATYQPPLLGRARGGAVYPNVAWRRAEWDRLRDADRFRVALDKAAYLRVTPSGHGLAAPARGRRRQEDGHEPRLRAVGDALRRDQGLGAALELVAWTHRLSRPVIDRWLAAPPGTPVPVPVV